MLTDPKLRSQVDALWDKFWTGDLPIRWMRLSRFRICCFGAAGWLREFRGTSGKTQGVAYNRKVPKDALGLLDVDEHLLNQVFHE